MKIRFELENIFIWEFTIPASDNLSRLLDSFFFEMVIYWRWNFLLDTEYGGV